MWFLFLAVLDLIYGKPQFPLGVTTVGLSDRKQDLTGICALGFAWNSKECLWWEHDFFFSVTCLRETSWKYDTAWLRDRIASSSCLQEKSNLSSSSKHLSSATGLPCAKWMSTLEDASQSMKVNVQKEGDYDCGVQLHVEWGFASDVHSL